MLDHRADYEVMREESDDLTAPFDRMYTDPKQLGEMHERLVLGDNCYLFLTA